MSERCCLAEQSWPAVPEDSAVSGALERTKSPAGPSHGCGRGDYREQSPIHSCSCLFAESRRLTMALIYGGYGEQLERAVATAGGNHAVSSRHFRRGHTPLKAETRVRIPFVLPLL